MGFLEDLRYFGPGLGLRRGGSLARAKLVKVRAKAGLRRRLASPEPESALWSRLGLPAGTGARRDQLRESWGPLVALGKVEPREDRDVRRDAVTVTAGRQRLFGRELTVGWPPRWDWRWDDTTNQSIFARDVRSTWELQRLQGILPLARASWQFPGEGWDERYLEAVLDFDRHAPGPEGTAWASALELGIRLVALAQGLPLVVDGPAWPEHGDAMLRMLDRHARWLRVDLSMDKVVRGNHLLGELAGLVTAGHLLPGARSAWEDGLDLQEILEKEILEQFHPDGVSVEQSLTYELFVLQFLIVAGEAAALRDRPYGEPVRRRLRLALDHLETVTAPDGTLPRIGDCDSGRGADFGEVDPHRTEATLRRGRALVGQDSGPGNGVTVFPAGGHLVLRTEARDHLVLRAGPFGWKEHGPASHSHLDLLAPVIHVEGEAFLVDPGVFGYGIDPDLRDAMRVASAHNGIQFEPPPGPRPHGTFRWTGFGLVATPREDDDGVGGEVRWPGAGLVWQRSIRYNHLDSTWSVVDSIQGARSTPVRWAFQLAPGAVATLAREPGSARVRLVGGRRLRITFEPAGRLQVEDGVVAPAYGQRTTAPVLRRTLDTIEPDHTTRIRIERDPDPEEVGA